MSWDWILKQYPKQKRNILKGSVVDPDPDPGSGSVLDPYSIGQLDPDPDP